MQRASTSRMIQTGKVTQGKTSTSRMNPSQGRREANLASTLTTAPEDALLDTLKSSRLITRRESTRVNLHTQASRAMLIAAHPDSSLTDTATAGRQLPGQKASLSDVCPYPDANRDYVSWGLQGHGR